MNRNCQIRKYSRIISFSVLILSLVSLITSCNNSETEPVVLSASEKFSLAGEAYSMGEWEQCRELLIEVASDDPNNPNVWRNLGTVSMDLGFYDEAVAAYENVLHLDSTRLDVLTDVTGALLGAGRLQEAVHMGEMAVRYSPSDGLAFNNYGMALMETGQFEEAASCFNTALRRAPDNASVLYNCGRISVLSGNFDEALSFFQQSISREPTYLAPQLELARTYGFLERHVEAEEIALSILAQNQTELEALSILALSYSAQGRQSEAIEILETLLEADSTDMHSRLGIAECYYRLGDMQMALENYELFISYLPDTTGTSQIRARILELEVLCD